jgi:hypothetical protein
VSELADELMDALGEDGFLALTEAHGGVRLYVPKDASGSQLSSEIGCDSAARLSKLFPGGYIRIPLAREFRARHYRSRGDSNAAIARRLGLTETGVDKLFSREPKTVGRGKKDPRQIEMF